MLARSNMTDTILRERIIIAVAENMPLPSRMKNLFSSIRLIIFGTFARQWLSNQNRTERVGRGTRHVTGISEFGRDFCVAAVHREKTIFQQSTLSSDTKKKKKNT